MAVTALSGQRWQGVLGENKVANFDGTGDYVTVDSLFSGTDPWSFSIWVYHTGGTSGNDGIIGAGSAEQLLYQGSSQKFGVKMGTGSHIYTDVTIAESTWYHLAGTRGSTGGVVFYLNGASSNTVSDAGSLPTGDWQIGYTAGSEYWQGSLTEYAVWDDRELTLAEVQAIYNSGSPTKLSDVTLNVSGANYSTNLIGYYPMGTNFDNAYSAGGGTNGVVSGDATANNSSPTSPISATNDKATVTDVPFGSEFEQTDDYKSYQLGTTYLGNTDHDDVAHFETSNELNKIIGEKITVGNPLIGKTITSIGLKLYRMGSGTATGLLSFGIWDFATGDLKGTAFGTIQADTIVVGSVPANAVEYTKVHSGSGVELAVNDIIGIRCDYTDASASADAIEVAQHDDATPDTYPYGARCLFTQGADSPASVAGKDIWFKAHFKDWVERGTAI